MARNIAIAAIFIIVFSVKSHAQRIPQDALYLQHNISVNPAYTGGKGQWYAHLYYAKQWVTAEGTPDYANLSVDGSINSKANFGFYAATEGMGLMRTISAAASYAYRLPLTQYADLSLGLSLGGIYNYVDVSSMSVLAPFDPLLNSFTNTMSPLISLGLFYESSLLYFGLSLRNLAGDHKIANNTELLLPDEKRNAVFTLGSFFIISDDLQLLPSVMWQEDMVSPSAWDFTLAMVYMHNYRVGVSFRTEQPLWKINSDNLASYSMALGGEIFWNRFVLGYTYSIGLSSFVSGYLGRHAVSLGYYVSSKLAHRQRIFHFKRHTEYCPTCY
jgi:type IX secretion system PorP/SprF family membrane protein